MSLPYKATRVEAGVHLVREQDRPESCCLLASGFVYRSKALADGSRQIVSFHFPGDIVDLQNALFAVADHNVQTLTQVDVAYIPRQAIIDLAFRHPQVGRALWLDTLVDASVFREWIVNVGRRSARSRLAHLLCEFGLRYEAAGLGSSCRYPLPMTQEQLGDATGLTAVHVNRVLQQLKAEELISRDGRIVKIDDWEGLREAAGFDATYLHAESAGGQA
jgi:CRP-like cAMP-binding protein